ncbi:MAG: HIT domain-containing protein [Chloroflexota bacterium]
MKRRIGKILFKIARSRMATAFTRFAFQHLTWLMPLSKLAENEHSIAFHHPVKHWQTHILIVPKQAVSSLMVLNFEDRNDLMLLQHVLKMAADTAKQQVLSQYVIIVNGLGYQDVPQLHFHLASGTDKAGKLVGSNRPSADDLVDNLASTTSFWNIYELDAEGSFHHTVFTSKSAVDITNALDALAELLNLIKTKIDSTPFRGYSVQFYADAAEPDGKTVINLIGTLSAEI